MKKTHLFSAIILLLQLTSCSQPVQSELKYESEKIDSKGTLVIEGGGDRIAIILDYIYCEKDKIDSPESLAKLDGVTAIFFSGGDQVVLSAYLEGTKFLEKIRDIYKNGGVVSGTSAGAAIMSRIMLTGEQKSDTTDSPEFNSILSNDVVTAKGFGFLNNIVIDQHFLKRKRQIRLISVLMDNPGLGGIGIDEETAIVVKPDNSIEVIGDNHAMLFEPYKPTDEKSNKVTSFKLTILTPGDTYKF